MILGVEMLDAKYIKKDDDFIYFNVKKGGQLDDKSRQKIANHAFNDQFGLRLKIRLVDKL